MLHLLNCLPTQLQNWMIEHSQPGYRAGQVWRWLTEKRAAEFDAMSDLPRELRGQLAAEFVVFSTRIAAQQCAADGTRKLLLELADGHRIECVLLVDDRGHQTVCISTQVGCAMGCAFCASGLDGVVRNLSTGEIVEQILQLQRLLAPDQRLSHVVVMGMGEPLANLDALLPGLALASSRKGLGISARRITISTVGLPAAIRRLANDHCPYHLALSLHAPNDELRSQLVPTNRKIGIQAILEATDEYFALTKRRVTYEYVLLAGVNDQPVHARELVALLRGRPALVNLIPHNPVEGLPYKTPAPTVTVRFSEILSQGGLSVAIRYRKGDRIDAACGQLRRSRGAPPAAADA
jgi:23S rRNA (adenine2503-C2)-methyltransferase